MVLIWQKNKRTNKKQKLFPPSRYHLACVVVYVFNHPTILQLLPLPTLFILAKRGSLWVWRRYKPLSYVDEATAELIIPKPIYGLWSVVRIGESRRLLRRTMGCDAE